MDRANFADVGIHRLGYGADSLRPEYYWLRFFLGLAEAGFLPAILVYISHWYRPADRGKAIAIFMASNPAAQVIGGPLAALFLKAHWLGYDGWRWLLLIKACQPSFSA